MDFVTCSVCGLRARRTGRQVSVDAIEWARLCETKPKSGPPDPLACEHMKKAVSQPIR